MFKILKYDYPDHKIKLKIRQFQVMGKSSGQINSIGYKNGTSEADRMQSPGALDRVSMICLMHDTHHLS